MLTVSDCFKLFTSKLRQYWMGHSYRPHQEPSLHVVTIWFFLMIVALSKFSRNGYLALLTYKLLFSSSIFFFSEFAYRLDLCVHFAENRGAERKMLSECPSL